MSKDERLAWIAGFFEGEGYLGIVRRSHGRFQLSLSIRQCERDPLQFIQSIFGGSLSVHADATLKSRQAWTWAVSRRGALHFLEAIQPFIIRKIMKKRVGIAIKYQRQVKSLGKANPKYNKRQRQFFEAMDSLKRRGVVG